MMMKHNNTQLCEVLWKIALSKHVITAALLLQAKKNIIEIVFMT